MATSRYKGFRIRARPYQLHESKRWTADLEVCRHGRAFPVGLHQRYDTEQETEVECIRLGRSVIDGGMPGWPADRLRRRRGRRHWPFSRLGRTGSMRPYLLAGIVLFCLGGFMLVRGVRITTWRDVVAPGDATLMANERQLVPPWVGGGIMVLGAGLIVAGAWKRRISTRQGATA